MAPPGDEVATFDAPAKVNLNLKLTGRRADGYHILDSTVIFTAFGDRLTIRPAAGEDRIDVTGPFATLLEGERDNICLRAINGYRAIGGMIGPLAVTIKKNIPVGAGLGGGSSDAAAMLRFLDRQATHRVDPDALAALAADLGADVPVCLAGVASRMRGIGDILDPVDPAPSGHIVLARPDAMLATPAVFRAFAEGGHVFAENNVAPDGKTAGQIVKDGNDLLAAAQHLCPEIGMLLDALRHCAGAELAQMTGSGSACFALFADAPQAAAAAARMTAAGHWAVASSF